MKLMLPLKVVIALLCVAVFAYQMSFIFMQFYNRETNTGIEYQFNKALRLPAVSICSSRPFKGAFQSPSEQDYLNNTHSYDNLFAKENKDKWNVSEFRSFIMGRCYSFTREEPVKSVSLDELIVIRSSHELNVYVHQEEEDFWLWYLLSPLGFASNVAPSSGNADLHIVRKEMSVLERGDNCLSYGDISQGFTHCAKEKIRQMILAEISCTTSAINWLLGDVSKDHNGLERCETVDLVGENDQKAGNVFPKFTQDPAEHGCHLPCSKITYMTRTNHFPEPEGKNKSEHELKMYVYYDTLMVEKQREVLVYDVPGFLSAAGGTLGLYLGFSCLTVLFGLINMTMRNKINNNNTAGINMTENSPAGVMRVKTSSQ